jgi:hypothetical protein
VVDDISSLPERVANSPASSSRDGVGLCLSGGGYRAMLFHVGALWRLNKLGWLRLLSFVSSVSGGSITAGLLAVKWRDLHFGDDSVAANFPAEIAGPLRTLADHTIDVSSVFTGILVPGTTVGDRTAASPARPPGLTAGLIHVLGPSHDPAVLRQMKPPASESYRSIVPAAIGEGGFPVAARPAPFSAALTLTQAEYENQYPILAKALSQTTRGRIINVGDTGEQDLLATIAGLDNAINNTSLIFTLEVGDDVLLLPGDAQWGPWQAILGNADTVALINRATFYKDRHPRQNPHHADVQLAQSDSKNMVRNRSRRYRKNGYRIYQIAR